MKNNLSLLMFVMLCAVWLHADVVQPSIHLEDSSQLSVGASINLSTESQSATSSKQSTAQSSQKLTDASINARAQQLINNAFESMDRYTSGTDPKQWGINQKQSGIQTIVQNMNKSFDAIGKSISVSTQSMQPIKDIFSRAITFFAVQSPENMGTWLPKIVDVAKTGLTASVKLALQVAGTGLGVGAGVVKGVAFGMVDAIDSPISTVRLGLSSDKLIPLSKAKSMQDLIVRSLFNASILIPEIIPTVLKDVIAAPVIVAYKIAEQAYVGARVGHDVTKNITGSFVSRNSKPAKSGSLSEVAAKQPETENNLFEVTGAQTKAEKAAHDAQIAKQNQEAVARAQAAELALEPSFGSNFGSASQFNDQFATEDAIASHAIQQQAEVQATQVAHKVEAAKESHAVI